MQARMRQVFLLTAIAMTLAVALGGTAFAQSVGTWKLNLAKSKYTQGKPPKSTTLKYEAVGAGIKATVDTVSADGAVIHYEVTTNYDGKDNPVIGNSPDRDMTARTRVNATTTTSVNKKGGKIMTNQTFVVSADGKMLTITTTGTDAKGQSVSTVAVYDKQ